MITPYLAQQPVTDYSLQFASLKYSVTLGATTDTTLTIPVGADYYKALIKAKNETWVALNATAAVPGGSSFAATTSEMISPYLELCREVKAGDVLHFYTATASTDVSVVLYATRHGTVGY